MQSIPDLHELVLSFVGCWLRIFSFNDEECIRMICTVLTEHNFVFQVNITRSQNNLIQFSVNSISFWCFVFFPFISICMHSLSNSNYKNYLVFAQGVNRFFTGGSWFWILLESCILSFGFNVIFCCFGASSSEEWEIFS